MPSVYFFDLAVVIFPLSLYFGFLALAHRAAMPLSAQLDLGFLGLGLGGLVFLGPLHLFVPLSSLAVKGWTTWLMVLSLYWLLVVFIGSMWAKRMVVYGVAPQDARRLLAEAAKRFTPPADLVRDDIIFLCDSDGKSLGRVEMRTSSVGRCATLTLFAKNPTRQTVTQFQSVVTEVFQEAPKDTSRWAKIWFPLFLMGLAAEAWLFLFHRHEIFQALLFYIRG
ncbi:MAG: hypothetical protein IIZ25_09130 [Thermoguttaceae bacterium]|nr:hypothetical protein [Thermoguttaceae bacterium]